MYWTGLYHTAYHYQAPLVFLLLSIVNCHIFIDKFYLCVCIKLFHTSVWLCLKHSNSCILCSSCCSVVLVTVLSLLSASISLRYCLYLCTVLATYRLVLIMLLYLLMIICQLFSDCLLCFIVFMWWYLFLSLCCLFNVDATIGWIIIFKLRLFVWPQCSGESCSLKELLDMYSASIKYTDICV